MKASIITMNSSYNYGAQLQAYSLKSTVESFGVKCNIIDRRKQIQKKVKLSKSPYDITAYLHKRELTLGYRAFENFDSLFHSLTSENYSEYEKLKNNPPVSDVYITGSDQVWNPLGFDPAYFLDFVPEGRKKVSYAASLGVSEIPNDLKNQYRNYINTFDEISVREEDAKKILLELTDKKISVCCDPVFLLSKEKWIDIEKPVGEINKPYILCYILYRPIWLNTVLRDIKRKTGKEIVLIDLTGWRNIYCDRYIRYAGPQEFIWLINNADGIVTSSFHGTAFSCIFEKPFLSIVNPVKPARIQNILTKLNLEDRATYNGDENIINKITEASDSTDKIRNLIDEANSFLQRGLFG